MRYNASKGVILACGGYSGNEAMMQALQPQSIEQTCVNYSKPGAKGDGIKACLWAGAIMDTTHTSMIFDRGAIKPDQVGEYGKASDGALFSRSGGRVRQGQRWCPLLDGQPAVPEGEPER